MKFRLVFYFVVLMSLLTACTENVIFDSSKEIPGGGWKSTDIVKFAVPIIDTLQPCNVYFNVRNKTDYGFSNLFLFMKTFYPNGKISIDTIECLLADNEGKWLGRRRNGRVDNRILFRKSIRFTMRGNYSFEFEQAMRTEELSGIENFGIRIEKFEKE
jgi:gliding motility-associated lipoprotein GldH